MTVGKAVCLGTEYLHVSTVFLCTEHYGLLDLRRLSDETVGGFYEKRKYFSI